MEDLYELYVLDLLDAEQALEIKAHLDEQCEVCTPRTSAARVLTSSLASLAPPVEPPKELRKRVLSLAKPPQQSAPWLYAFAAAAVLAFLLFGWGYQQLAAKRALTSEMAELQRERNALRSAVAILSESDTRTVQFGANQGAAHGRVFVSGNGGVVFVGSQLPELAADRTFELWLIPRQGNPQPAGGFKANTAGVSVDVLKQPVDTASIAAVAVSVEPGSGSPQPTTKPILIIPLA
jgi:anti-sigma-K factor RskA